MKQTLAEERTRLTAILKLRLDKITVKTLDALYIERDGIYAVTPLKRDPKDFSLGEMKRVISRIQTLEVLHRTAKELLPEVGISNDRYKASTKLILSEDDNIKHVLASLAMNNSFGVNARGFSATALFSTMRASYLNFWSMRNEKRI